MRRRGEVSSTDGNVFAKLDEKELISKIELCNQELNALYGAFCEAEHSTYPARVIDQTITELWAMYHGDCVEVTKGMETKSIHYSIFSPPFLSLYVYSDDRRDMGNAKTDAEFYTHFAYLIPELYRVLMPGRLVSVHCSLVPMTLQHDGVMGLRDFPGAIVRLFQQFGFIYHSKVMIWKDPLVQATRTKMLCLAHKQISKDSTRCAMGFADEILTFRKPGNNLEPVSHGRGFEDYIGQRDIPKKTGQTDDARTNKFSHEIWQRYASPVWMDIRQSDTLNFRMVREARDERHICPLQLGTIARCLELWTNKGDIVYSPFAGIGSEGYESLLRGRKFVGVELKKSYYEKAIENLKDAESGKASSFFDD